MLLDETGKASSPEGSNPLDSERESASREDLEKSSRIQAYNARRSGRIDRLRSRADRRRSEGNGLLQRADSIASFIPPGQPILVGHHSERRHRRDLERIHNSTRKGLGALSEAKDLDRRAAAAEANTTIFTEDPEAKAKLEERIQTLEKIQAMMREANKRIRAGRNLSDLGISDSTAALLKEADELGRVGFPDYKLKNNSANIRRLKLRLAALTKAWVTPVPIALEKGGIRIVEEVDLNRVQIFFPGKPSGEVRVKLKRSGFRWSPFNGCWQRHRSSVATQLAKEFLEPESNPS